MPGEFVAGDAAFTERRGDYLHLGLVDGLGHGRLAAEAANAVCETLSQESWEELVQLIDACDRAAKGTRGAALALVRVHCSSGQCDHVAVGNVEVVVSGEHGQRITPLPRAGVVGAGAKRLRVTSWTLQPADVMVMHTDGISRRFDLVTATLPSAEQAARALIDTYGKQHDDASCIVLYFDA